MLLECSKEIRWLINYPRFHCFRYAQSCSSILRVSITTTTYKLALKSPLASQFTHTLRKITDSKDNRITTVHRRCNTNFAKHLRIINRMLSWAELSCYDRTARFTFCPAAGAARTLNIRAAGRTGRTSTWSGWAVRAVAAVCVVRSSYFPAP